jgi:hypothetical protein
MKNRYWNRTVIVEGQILSVFQRRGFTFNGFSDWSLPSVDELARMCLNLRVSGIHDFGAAGFPDNYNGWFSCQRTADMVFHPKTLFYQTEALISTLLRPVLLSFVERSPAGNPSVVRSSDAGNRGSPESAFSRFF